MLYVYCPLYLPLLVIHSLRPSPNYKIFLEIFYYPPKEGIWHSITCSHTRAGTDSHPHRMHAHRLSLFYASISLYLYIPASSYYILTYVIVIYKFIFFLVLTKWWIFESKNWVLYIFAATLELCIIKLIKTNLITLTFFKFLSFFFIFLYLFIGKWYPKELSSPGNE